MTPDTFPNAIRTLFEDYIPPPLWVESHRDNKTIMFVEVKEHFFHVVINCSLMPDGTAVLVFKTTLILDDGKTCHNLTFYHSQATLSNTNQILECFEQQIERVGSALEAYGENL